MSTQTTNLNLVKQESTETYDYEVTNGNLDILDTEVFSRVKKINGISPDSSGEVTIESVPVAEQLASSSSQYSEGTFIERTTGGNASVGSGSAWLVTLKGKHTHTGYTAPSVAMTVTPMPREEGEEEITATIDDAAFLAEMTSTSGTKTFTYSTEWTDDPADFGITVTGTPIAGDQISVVYQKEVRGTITQTNPTSFTSTGWNLYNHTTGYAKVIKYSDTYGFAISGTYTAVQFSTTLTGEKSSINPDANGLFTVDSDGYVWVTGGNSTDTAIWMTWFDWIEGYSGGFKAYSESTVDFSTLMSAFFATGLFEVDEYQDEINFGTGIATSRVLRTSYSAENLASAIESGMPYEYDENYIYVARDVPLTYIFTVDAEYSSDDHGLERFSGTTLAVECNTIYGVNLKNKLERDVLTISQQTLTSSEKQQVQENLGLADAASSSDIGIVVNGNKTGVGITAAIGQYVILKNSTITGKDDGLYTAEKAIPANTVIDGTYLSTAVSGGGLNALSDQMSKKLFFAASLQEIDLAIPNSGDVAVVAGSTSISSNVGFTSGIVVGICTRVKNSSSNRIDFLFSQQNGGLSNGRIDVGDNYTYTVTYHTGTLGS
jgi:hypothetical protein